MLISSEEAIVGTFTEFYDELDYNVDEEAPKAEEELDTMMKSKRL